MPATPPSAKTTHPLPLCTARAGVGWGVEVVFLPREDFGNDSEQYMVRKLRGCSVPEAGSPP